MSELFLTHLKELSGRQELSASHSIEHHIAVDQTQNHGAFLTHYLHYHLVQGLVALLRLVVETRELAHFLEELVDEGVLRSLLLIHLLAELVCELDQLPGGLLQGLNVLQAGVQLNVDLLLLQLLFSENFLYPNGILALFLEDLLLPYVCIVLSCFFKHFFDFSVVVFELESPL